MREVFLKYAMEHGLTEAQTEVEWAQVEADMSEIRDEEDRKRGEGSEHWNTNGSPRCPLEHAVETENCGNCERSCPHNEVSWLRVPLSEWDVLDGYEPLPETPEPTI